MKSLNHFHTFISHSQSKFQNHFLSSTFMLGQRISPPLLSHLHSCWKPAVLSFWKRRGYSIFFEQLIRNNGCRKKWEVFLRWVLKKINIKSVIFTRWARFEIGGYKMFSRRRGLLLSCNNMRWRLKTKKKQTGEALEKRGEPLNVERLDEN